MALKLKNNVIGFLATTISASDTGLVVQAGTGGNFPALAAGDYFFATLSSTGGTSEIVKVTARVGDTMTIVRGQDGSTANSFAAGSRIEMRINAQSVRDVLTDVLIFVSAYGAVGDGVTDDTLSIQTALNAAVGRTLVFDKGATYRYTAFTVPANSTLRTNDCTFSRISASTSPGVIIQNDVLIDKLQIVTPGGLGGDRGVRITGSDVEIGFLSVIAAAEQAWNTAGFGLEVFTSGSPPTTQIENITIGGAYIKNMRAGIYAWYVQNMDVRDVVIEYYRTGVYLRDVSRSVFDNVTCNFTSSACYGSPGENGLLIESHGSTQPRFCFDLHFNRWTVTGAGEHSYRIGGQFATRDIWFTNCRSFASGSAIVVNNPAATEWHGGCGFKVLGATSVVGRKHRNIFFDNCVVEDIDDTYGSFPTGHGQGNFSGFQIGVSSHVYLNNCTVKARNQTLSSADGLSIYASDNVHITNSAFRDMRRSIRIFEEGGTPGVHPGWDLPNEYIYIGDCEFHSASTSVPVVAINGYIKNVKYNHKHIYIQDCVIRGSAVAIRVERINGGGGSYENLFASFTYRESLANPATATQPVVTGENDVLLFHAVSNWHPASLQPVARIGSTFVDVNTNTLRRKDSSGNWGSYGVFRDNIIGSTNTTYGNTKLGVAGGFAGFSRTQLFEAQAEISLLCDVNTNNSMTPMLTLHSDRKDRYAAIGMVRGLSSNQIGLALLAANNTSTPVEGARLTPTGEFVVGTTTPNAAAKVQIDSTTQGFLLPRMTTVQRDAIAAPPSGLMIFNTTTNKLNVRGASAWEEVTSV